MFSYKLNFLMNMTNTSNSAMAHSISLDASHISRLRRGQRKLPKNQNFLVQMSEFFAHQIKDDYQKKVLLSAIQVQGKNPVNEKAFAELIFGWLSEDNNRTEHSVENILNNFMLTTSSKEEMPILAQEQEHIDFNNSNNFYYGIVGKREAIVRFLSMIVNEDVPQTLLLFSDEELSWLYEDTNFVKQWSALLKQVLLKGNRIKIIHTVNRNINEMLEAVAKWVPVYMSGSIEPYYYPKLRDGIFKRTLFISPKTAAIVSTSIQENTNGMVNFFVTDERAIDALSQEYANHFSLCRPLMRIFNLITSERYWNIFSEIEEAKATTIMIGTVPSLMTMPYEIASGMSKSLKSKLLIKINKKSVQSFTENITNHTVTEILSLPSIDQIVNGSVCVPLSDMIDGKGICYTKGEFRMHLENVVDLLKKFPNYNVLLNKNNTENIMLYGKEDIGVMITKCHFPSVVFAISEQNMTSAFWDYLLLAKNKASEHNKKNVISQLNNIIEQL